MPFSLVENNCVQLLHACYFLSIGTLNEALITDLSHYVWSVITLGEQSASESRRFRAGGKIVNELYHIHFTLWFIFAIPELCMKINQINADIPWHCAWNIAWIRQQVRYFCIFRCSSTNPTKSSPQAHEAPLYSSYKLLENRRLAWRNC